ncbi:hypothetical protein D9M71_386150 [compost metagenome]
MQMAWSANATWRRPASAWECTAIVRNPMSLAARNTRNAISPRFAISTLSNSGLLMIVHRLDCEQRATGFNHLAVIFMDCNNASAAISLNGVEHLHGFNYG